MRQDRLKTLRILIKSVLLFAIFNYSFAFIPNSAIWHLSLYNNVLPGRPRFTQEDDLNLLFGTHEIANSAKHQNEYKVIVLGDSSTWGYLLNPKETFSGVINGSNLETCRKQTVHIYNLGYPQLSLFKDLILMQEALKYKPDLIIWMITLNSTLRETKQHPMVDNNSEIAQKLNEDYQLGVEINPSSIDTIKQKTFLARRNILARFIQYQLDGIRWASIGEDAHKKYEPIGLDVTDDNSFGGLPPPMLDPQIIQFEILQAGTLLAKETPIIIVNEPIQIVTGENKEIRYNRNYPRWAYDQYRELMKARSVQDHWDYRDFWDLLPPTEFTDSAVHRTVNGEKILAEKITEVILEAACP